ncbi:S-adenosylmethionine tRNA ribosyltransferase [Elstera litoralis]|uniref:S-adenosylmethionine:tRNA ribosyltransferase-isomerase n=1 Tax=Elstera litoralis TaxID=552518 RepID=A0A0F3IW73_9PROT|nr:tRNA preQ1(34) S-adenosylmethionine ribosyltransferase-isomerase QueA [Elstera litoralis]KJV10877.1 S-adenosylmethionine tRNA ribosyltransferase [Elstera litoralis]
MNVADFDFDLPGHLIAERPMEPREGARLLCVGEALEDRIIGDLPTLFGPGDVIVFNDTRVIPARLHGVRARQEGGVTVPVELLLHQRQGDGSWTAFAKPGKRLKIGDTILIGEVLRATLLEKRDSGEVLVQFDRAGADLTAALEQVGEMPLPPYIRRAQDAQDRHDYQTIFATKDGAVAAPTAGLHITPRLLEALKARGVLTETVTLHVGAGTFQPVKVDRIEDHKMHSEWAELSPETAARLNAHRASGGRIIACGTTSLRTLESAVAPDRSFSALAGSTEIFLYPGKPVYSVDRLLTNFHLPRSTLFMLVSAFAGQARMRAAYDHAIASGYRFFSYGDACLLERA